MPAASRHDAITRGDRALCLRRHNHRRGLYQHVPGEDAAASGAARSRSRGAEERLHQSRTGKSPGPPISGLSLGRQKISFGVSLLEDTRSVSVNRKSVIKLFLSAASVLNVFPIPFSLPSYISVPSPSQLVTRFVRSMGSCNAIVGRNLRTLRFLRFDSCPDKPRTNETIART